MIWVDFIILGIIGVSALISLVRGFVREAFSLAAWVLAFWVAWSFFRDLSPYLSWFSTPSVRHATSFITLFIVTLMLGGLVNFLIGQLVDKTGLGGMDRLLGMLFGAARGGVLVAILVVLAGLTPLPNDPWWQQSQLIGYFQELAIWLRSLLPPEISEHFNFVQ